VGRTGRDESRVYLIGREAGGLSKIGVSINVRKRLQGLESAAGERLVVLWTTEGDWTLEYALHSQFRDRRKLGEWFDFSDVDPIPLVDEAATRLRKKLPKALKTAKAMKEWEAAGRRSGTFYRDARRWLERNHFEHLVIGQLQPWRKRPGRTA
jgi:hypothetical protein